MADYVSKLAGVFESGNLPVGRLNTVVAYPTPI
jgi:hypothetical protein